MRSSRLASVGLIAFVGALPLACGSSQNHTKGETSASGSTAGAIALPAEAQSRATGDIPDNQVFLTFENRRAGYSVRYPEGWGRQGEGDVVRFTERANTIRLTVARGAPATTTTVRAELERERSSRALPRSGAPSRLSIGGAAVVKISYTTLSPPSAVTGKRAQLLVDRYVFASRGRVATLDLATPKGVDNVDAYKLISRSFRWR